MGRMAREVEIYTSHDPSRSCYDGRWWAEVERGVSGSGDIVYTTTWHVTERAAIADAEAWCKENGFVTMAF